MTVLRTVFFCFRAFAQCNIQLVCAAACGRLKGGAGVCMKHFQLNFQARGILNNDFQAALENFYAFSCPCH